MSNDAEFLANLLRVALGNRELHTDEMSFAVITAGGSEHWDVPRQRMVPDAAPYFWPFDQGELIVLDNLTDREPFGQGRKPSKWEVVCEDFGRDYEAALRRSEAVKCAPAQFARDVTS